ncbi:MAG: metallophosphoesterase [Ignavibacterium sp.]|nr:MAG: metallophosphoesterase [Ignavibacterium sp.]
MKPIINIKFPHYFLLFFLVIVFSSNSFALSANDSTDVEILYRVILIGDAGEPAKDHPEPVLVALRKEASIVDSTVVVFLGDNIYPNGLPDENHKKRKEYERRLDEQINIVEDEATYFIAGNHDWSSDNDVGWKQVNRQADFISNKNLPHIKFAPLNACPGPEMVSFGSKVNLIFLDSQWFLQKKGRPSPEDCNCKYYKDDDIINATDSLLSLSKNKYTIIAAHHPLSTHGPHGGHFTWKQHIFPLTEVGSALWIPLPIIGSSYPLARNWGISSQDISSGVYGNYISKMENVLSKYSGIVYASGHEHSIQIIDGVGDNTYVVSGAGIYDHTTSLGEGEDTIVSGEFAGFVVIDLLQNDRTKLSVIKVLNIDGDIETTFTMWLDE